MAIQVLQLRLPNYNVSAIQLPRLLCQTLSRNLKSLLGTLLSKNDRRWVHFQIVWISLMRLSSILAAALEFKCCSPFINPLLASPDLVVVEKDHLIWDDSRANAVFFYH